MHSRGFTLLLPFQEQMTAFLSVGLYLNQPFGCVSFPSFSRSSRVHVETHYHMHIHTPNALIRASEIIAWTCNADFNLRSSRRICRETSTQ